MLPIQEPADTKLASELTELISSQQLAVTLVPPVFWSMKSTDGQF